MNIEPLTSLSAADTIALLKVWENSVRATHGFLSEDDITALRREVPEYFGAVSLWIAREEDGRMAGFAGAAGNSLEMLFVRDEARGRGIGGALLRRVVSRGVTALDVNEQNPQARAFYEHMGFEVTARSPLDGQGRPFPLLHMHLKGFVK